jgi:hypothetical protein
MSWLDRAERIKALRDSLGMAWPSCVNCYHFFHGHPTLDGLDSPGAYCMLDPWKRLPPPMVIAKGCHQFEEDHDPLGLEDDVPF